MKQTALQQLIAWGDEKIKTEPMKLLSFAEVIDKAEALLKVEREQIEDAVNNSGGYVDEVFWEEQYTWTKGEQYYKKTYES
jgi:hypothetical protein